MEDRNEKKLKLIVVDDMEAVCEIMELYFAKRGFIVFKAGSAEEALPVIKQEEPDIMLLDVNLPKMSGIELVKLVREFNHKIKVILISGSRVEDNPQLNELNISAILEKPADFDQLEKAINKAFE